MTLICIISDQGSTVDTLKDVIKQITGMPKATFRLEGVQRGRNTEFRWALHQHVALRAYHNWIRCDPCWSVQDNTFVMANLIYIVKVPQP